MFKRLLNHLLNRRQYNRTRRFLRDRSYGRFSFSCPHAFQRTT